MSLVDKLFDFSTRFAEDGGNFVGITLDSQTYHRLFLELRVSLRDDIPDKFQLNTPVGTVTISLDCPSSVKG